MINNQYFHSTKIRNLLSTKTRHLFLFVKILNKRFFLALKLMQNSKWPFSPFAVTYAQVLVELCKQLILIIVNVHQMQTIVHSIVYL